MGRSRGFDERQVIDRAAALFTDRGYEATSIDDLVGVTGLHRGSLYHAFGSKRGIFLAVLDRLVAEQLPAAADRPEGQRVRGWLDVLLVAALELAPHDQDVRSLLRRGCALLEPSPVHDIPREVACLLGQRLLDRAGIGSSTTESIEEHPWRT